MEKCIWNSFSHMKFNGSYVDWILIYWQHLVNNSSEGTSSTAADHHVMDWLLFLDKSCANVQFDILLAIQYLAGALRLQKYLHIFTRT